MPPLTRKFKPAKRRRASVRECSSFVEESIVDETTPVSSLAPVSLCRRLGMSSSNPSLEPTPSTRMLAPAPAASTPFQIESLENRSHDPPQRKSRVSLETIASTVPKFDGKPASVQYFIRQCRRANAAAPAEDKQLLLDLISRKFELDEYLRITESGDPSDVEELISALELDFAGTINSEATMAEFRGTTRKPGETIGDFGKRLKAAYGQALRTAIKECEPGETAGTKRTLGGEAVAILLKGINNDVISNSVMEKCRYNITAAVSLAVQTAYNIGLENKPLETKPATIKAKSFAIQSRPECFYCHKPGHVRADCRILRRDQENRGNRSPEPRRDTPLVAQKY